MSIKAVDWALREAPVTDTAAKLILVGLANHATDEGTSAYPSRETLARYAACSVRTVQSKLHDLIESGIITRGDQQIVAHLRGGQRPVVYDLNFHAEMPLPTPAESAQVQDLHASNEDRGVQSTTSRGANHDNRGVQLIAHNTSLEPSNEPSMDDGAVDSYIHLVSVSDDGASAVFRHNGKLYVGVDAATPQKLADVSVPRDDAGGPPALSLAPGVELPKRNGWRPSARALATAKSAITITDIELHILRYEILKADKNQQPSDSEWLKWLIQDERQAKAEQLRHQQESRQARRWDDVAD